MFYHIDTAGFKANVTVYDKENVIFKGIADNVKLLIDRGIKFYFSDKDLLAYQQLGLDKLYYLNEATMECKIITSTESFGLTIHKELQIDILNSEIIINIEPTD